MYFLRGMPSEPSSFATIWKSYQFLFKFLLMHAKEFRNRLASDFSRLIFFCKGFVKNFISLNTSWSSTCSSITFICAVLAAKAKNVLFANLINASKLSKSPANTAKSIDAVIVLYCSPNRTWNSLHVMRFPSVRTKPLLYSMLYFIITRQLGNSFFRNLKISPSKQMVSKVFSISIKQLPTHSPLLIHQQISDVTFIIACIVECLKYQNFKHFAYVSYVPSL